MEETHFNGSHRNASNNQEKKKQTRKVNRATHNKQTSSNSLRTILYGLPFNMDIFWGGYVAARGKGASNDEFRTAFALAVGSIIIRCSGNEPTLLPRKDSSRGGTKIRLERAAEIEPILAAESSMTLSVFFKTTLTETIIHTLLTT